MGILTLLKRAQSKDKVKAQSKDKAKAGTGRGTEKDRRKL